MESSSDPPSMQFLPANGAKNSSQANNLMLKSEYSRKEFVTGRNEGYEVDSVLFTILSAEEIMRYSEVKVCNKELYFPMTNEPMPFGVLDSRLGANKANGQCKTCGQPFQDCCGHWGHVALYHPVFHVGYFKHLINLLYCICKKCARLLLSDEDKKLYLQRSRRCHDPIVRRVILKRLVAKCKKESVCLHPDCAAPQGMLRRVMKPSLDQFMKIVLQKKVRRDGPGTVAARTTVVNEDLDARFIRHLLQRLSAIDCEVLDVRMPEKLLMSSLIIPPKCIRPSVTLGDAGTNEDDLTIVFSEIVDLNNILSAQSNGGLQSQSVLGNWEFLQLQCTRFINSEAPSVQTLLASKNISSPGRGICQRLKGKEGRFRGNLSGKRVDFSGRTVISPDANCPIAEVVIPMWSAKRLTFPERVCEATIEKLRAAVLRGADDWPGAAFVIKKDGGKSSLRFANRRHVAENLQNGDIVERHMWNGDIVLFNRQPSLHRLSIMAHRARVMPWRTFRFNECVCTPYNADFDGDEMNCHLPQTQEARAEAYHLMGVVNNLVTPKNGEPLIAATQDFLSGTYLLTSKDTFITRDRFCLFCCYFTDGKTHIDLPPPSILKPIELWTGKQVIDVLLRPNKYSENVMVSFEVREREFCKPNVGEPDFLCPKDGYVIFRNSELICGALAKMTLGNGSKKGLFFNLIRDNSPQLAAACMGRIAKLAGRWFGNRGMTIGIDDVTPNADVTNAKAALLTKGYNDVSQAITNFKKGAMQPNPGCTLEETLETQAKAILDDLRTLAGKAAQDNLPPTNKPLIMFLSGAKGALINIAQMIALVGQQNVGGQRIQNGFVERTLPHFKHKSQDAKARGFVAHSFYDGLDPDEFFFHTMSGREGLVDTAVKTAETGYMQRRLVKALEDLSVRYDRTVRTSDGQIVQFVYGDDGLNPCVMEDKAKPFSLTKIFHHIFCLTRIETRLSIFSKQLNILPSSTHSVSPKNNIENDVIFPPVEDQHSTLFAALLRKHLSAADRRLRQRQAGTRRLLAGFGTQENHPSSHKLFSAPTIQTTGKRPRNNSMSNGDDSLLPGTKIQVVGDVQQALIPTSIPIERIVYNIPSTTQKIPRSLEEKLLVMQSWKTSGLFQKNPSLLESDKTYLQVKNNVTAHVAVHEWLPIIKQHAPLLPYEIRQWANYLMPRTAEVLPGPLKAHQDACLLEEATHQKNTEEVKVFSQELERWVNSKVEEIAAYRKDNSLHPGDSEASYYLALEALKKPVLEHKTEKIVSSNSTGSYLKEIYPECSLERRAWIVPESKIIIKQEMEDDIDLSRTENCLVSTHTENELAISDVNSSDCLNVSKRWKYNRHYWVTVRHLLEFFRLAWRKYNRALIEPGEAVGATGAQSIGEPGTQMTLKTFHFAGVASMNVTLGVPRIKEIINAANKIMTPIIQVPLVNDLDFDYALMVKSRIEKTLLGEVCSNIKEVYSPEGAFLSLKLHKETISKIFLDITADSVRESILATPGLLGSRVKLKDEYVEVLGEYKLVVRPPSTEFLFFDLQSLKQRLQTVRLAGLKEIKRGVIKREEIKNSNKTETVYSYSLAVEGYGLRDVMGISGVKGTQCTSNHVMEVKDVRQTILGIEAARRVIIDEIRNCMEAYSMDIDCRHMQLLGDVMTFRGDVLGISRFGIQKMRASTLMLASFEETNEHLFEAAAHNREDKVKGVSECIIMGKAVSLGTGAFDVLYNYNNQWTGAVLDGCRAGPKATSTKRATLLLSKYGKVS